MKKIKFNVEDAIERYLKANPDDNRVDLAVQVFEDCKRETARVQLSRLAEGNQVKIDKDVAAKLIELCKIPLCKLITYEEPK